MDREKPQRVIYIKGDREMGLKVNLPTFKNLHLLGNDFAEIELTKTKEKLNYLCKLDLTSCSMPS